MSLNGWIIMGLSVFSVTVLLAWCIYKVITTPDEQEHVHGFESTPPDVD